MPTPEITPRDFVMARLLAARNAAQASIDAIDEATSAFIDPDEDDEIEERTELIEEALEASGACARALESAQAMLPEVDAEEGEPWDEDEEEVVEETLPELPKATARRRRR